MTDETGEIFVIYLSDEDARGIGLVPGWYYETDYTDVPVGPYKAREYAERRARLSVQQEQAA
jgi:hypothetical protein